MKQIEDRIPWWTVLIAVVGFMTLVVMAIVVS